MSKRIIVLAPANAVTGGPELLHQLCYKLRLMGFDSGIYYLTDNDDDGTEVPAPYSKYNVTVFSSIEDTEENTVIVPEYFLFLLSSFKHAKRVLWWLSVDNAMGYDEEFEYAFYHKDIYHFSQSEYSSQYLLSKGVDENNIMWLGDYINSEFLCVENIPNEKKNAVAYNPRKGVEKTDELIKNSNGSIEWIKLEGYTPTELRTIFQTIKVYIDFGNHPGRDRLPREATYCGCCILTNKNGSAANDIDIPIDSKYKVEHDTKASDVIDRILHIMNNYSEETEKLSEYRTRTAEEFRTFEVDAMTCFERIIGDTCNSEIIAKQDKNIKISKDEIREKVLLFISECDYKKAFEWLVKYRQLQYDEDVEYLIMEATVRAELNELNEAEYIAKKVLAIETNNYEAILLLARIHLLMRTQESITCSLHECKDAIVLSKGTEDEEVVFALADSYINEIRKLTYT